MDNLQQPYLTMLPLHPEDGPTVDVLETHTPPPTSLGCRRRAHSTFIRIGIEDDEDNEDDDTCWVLLLCSCQARQLASELVTAVASAESAEANGSQRE